MFYDSYNTSCVITLGPRCLQRCSKPLASCKMAAKAGAQEPSHTSTKNGMHTQGILKFGHCLSGGSHLHSAPSNTAVSCTQLCDSSDKVKCMPAVMCPQVTERCHARQRAPRCKNYRRQRQLFSGIFVSGYVLNVTGGPALTDYVCDIFPPPPPSLQANRLGNCHGYLNWGYPLLWNNPGQTRLHLALACRQEQVQSFSHSIMRGTSRCVSK